MSSFASSDALPALASSQQYISPFSSQHGYAGRGIPSYFASRRHKKILRDNLKAAMNKPTIRRLARRGGIGRIKSDIYPTVQQVVRERLKLIIEHACALVDLAGRKTMTALDVVFALKSLGNPIYGFGSIERGEGIADHAARYRAKKVKLAENRRRVERELASRSVTNSRDDNRISRTGSDEGRASTRELQDQRVDHFMKQMKRGARC